MKYVLIVLVIFLLFGAKKLPELGRSLGQSLREFKDATKGLADDEEKKTDR
ncbi:twin-arginine translocase TatA/TatE family subunit [Anoxybacillus geothermalis]|nr:twin-arginine translocase TatA/TatE family subunit [Anoxybacillus geothermalis]MED4924614.1 twin-arginine translocase TatA/TatE family subunit [Anoxybacillus geothermalis]MED5073696.1 twin-arginine translocase TatA/TatE family subunit [Anoxybacillus geothermalis]